MLAALAQYRPSNLTVAGVYKFVRLTLFSLRGKDVTVRVNMRASVANVTKCLNRLVLRSGQYWENIAYIINTCYCMINPLINVARIFAAQKICQLKLNFIPFFLMIITFLLTSVHLHSIHLNIITGCTESMRTQSKRLYGPL